MNVFVLLRAYQIGLCYRGTLPLGLVIKEEEISDLPRLTPWTRSALQACCGEDDHRPGFLRCSQCQGFALSFPFSPVPLRNGFPCSSFICDLLHDCHSFQAVRSTAANHISRMSMPLEDRSYSVEPVGLEIKATHDLLIHSRPKHNLFRLQSEPSCEPNIT